MMTEYEKKQGNSTVRTNEKTLLNWFGLLGMAGLISYMVAVIVSPIAYPGYDSLSQAVSDLSAQDAPSRQLWAKLSSIYGTCGIVCISMVCVYARNRFNKTIRIGIYMFAVMNWISNIGYSLFPLSTSGYVSTFQNIIHIYVVTLLVVVLSIVSLVLIMIGGYRDKKYKSIAIWATIALTFMFAGTIGTNLVPRAYFGVFERFSVYAATAFTAVLGIYMFKGVNPQENN